MLAITSAVSLILFPTTRRTCTGRVRQPKLSASVTVPCGDAFDERLQWLLSFCDEDDTPLLRVEEIGPADSPRYARVAGSDISLWLNRDAPALPLMLRLAPPAALPHGAAPAGCSAELVQDDCDGHPRALPLPLRMPTCVPQLSVSFANDGDWGVGRAGMLYRDLLPDRAGGAAIVSHIRIPHGGPVPDYVHYHRIRFQLIYVLRGWVDVVYEGQGPPFRLSPGDFVTQPPTLRHRVLACSDNLEVLEIGAPAEHATLADHDHPLPDTEDRSTDYFGGQLFVRHVAESAAGDGAVGAVVGDVEGGLAWQKTCVKKATRGLANVRVGRSVGTSASTSAVLVMGAADTVRLGFVLHGTASLELMTQGAHTEQPPQRFELSQDAFFCLPPEEPCQLEDISPDFAILEMQLTL
jgi:quercetin dioxygenase-like cupin family protein